jgi:uncharacterized repeat protein (TIGR01451 family)
MPKKNAILVAALVLSCALAGSARAAGPVPFGPPGALALDATPCPIADPYETAGAGARDDYFVYASTITTAGQPGHTFDQYADKDWAAFDAEPGYLYTITTSNLTPTDYPNAFYADTVLGLFEADGVTQITDNDDYNGTFASRIIWQPSVAGTRLIKIYNHVLSTYGCGVGYDLNLSRVESLQIDKTAVDLNGPPLLEGDTIRYTIRVTNTNDTETHANVVISDVIPNGTTFVPGSAVKSQGSFASLAPVLRLNAGSLGPHAVASLAFSVKVDAGTAGLTIANHASVSSDQIPLVTTPPVSSGEVFSPNGLVISKSAADLNGPPLNNGDLIRYTIVVTNQNVLTHTNVVITDAIPSGVTYVEGSVSATVGTVVTPVNGLLQVSIPQLRQGGVVQVSFSVRVNHGASQIGGNMAYVKSDTQPSTSAGPVYPPGGGAVHQILTIGKTAADLNGAPLNPGDEIKYTIVVRNQLAITHTGIVISDAIPAYTAYVTGSAATTSGTISGTDPLLVSVDLLAPGGVVTVTFRVAVLTGSLAHVIGNLAQVDSDQQDRPADTALVTTGPVVPYWMDLPVVLR